MRRRGPVLAERERPAELQLLMPSTRKQLARQLAADFPGLVSVAQAEQMLAILDDSLENARWCCETVKGGQQHFKDPLDPVQLARNIAKRKGWQPTLQPTRRKASTILATLAGLMRDT